MTRWQSILRAHLRQSAKPIIVILGPTASGKTAFSLEVAKYLQGERKGHPLPSEGRGQGEGWPERGRDRERGSKEFLYPLSLALSPRERELQAEIINADSRQLYKYMDVGTAKITKEEMGDIPHHLFSVLDPKEKVTAGWYKQEAEKAIDGVLARGNVPILVGGSMLYISAVTDGYVFTGRGGKHRAPVPYDLLIFGMQWPREELVRRIEERTEQLLGIAEWQGNSLPLGGRVTRPIRTGSFGRGERGSKEFLYPLSRALSPRERELPKTWIQEVSWLLAHGYTISDPGTESCGYREIAAWILNGKKEEEFPQLMERINTVTRQYAKRQMTWWKHDERIHWIYADDVACRP